MTNGAGARLVVIGGGAMATAALRGAFSAGTLKPGEVVVAEPDAGRRATLGALGVGVVERASEVLDRKAPDGQTLVATKPQSLADVTKDLSGRAVEGIVISILAGAKSDRVRSALGGKCRVVRAMPNLAAQVGKGAAAIALGAGANAGDEAFAVRLFESVGIVVRVEEGMVDAFTALAGSGPAYIFYLAEAMTRAAREVGFDAPTADRLVRAVIAGSAELLTRAADQSPVALRAGVTSKGGTTQAACETLDRAGVMEAFVQAIVAARDRGKELGR